MNSALVRAINGEQFTVGSNYNAYLSTIIHNCAINLYRVKQKNSIVDDIDNIAESYSKIVVTQPDIDMKDFLKDVIKDITDWLSNKKEDCWIELFKIHFLDGAKYEECAKQLDMPLGTIKTRIHMIRKYAKQKYGNSCLVA